MARMNYTLKHNVIITIKMCRKIYFCFQSSIYITTLYGRWVTKNIT